MQGEEKFSESHFALRKIGGGYVGVDGSRFLRLALHDDVRSPKVTHFSTPEAAGRYAKEVVGNRFAVELVKVFTDVTVVTVGPSFRS